MCPCDDGATPLLIPIMDVDEAQRSTPGVPWLALLDTGQFLDSLWLDLCRFGPDCWKMYCPPEALHVLFCGGLRGMPFCALWNRAGDVHASSA